MWNEKMLADKIENISKTAIQEWSKELRGKIQTNWQIEMDEEMMTMFLKLKKKFGENLSNKEAMRRILKKIDNDGFSMMEGGVGGDEVSMMGKNEISRTQAQNPLKIPGGNHEIFLKSSAKGGENEKSFIEISKKHENIKQFFSETQKITRYIPSARKKEILSATNGKCSHQHCVQPAQIFHHQVRFSQIQNHDSVIPLCKTHHEFAHNGITEPMNQTDFLYRDYRQKALL
ncbi:hypothetical protein HZC20_01605 [Candidatus Peregrinibacteria bacterium]|nr:hypothetical protein [Candidatus Peregrinibacteria bacterium]